MKIRPLNDRILVKRLEEERKTASGIVIPDTAAEKPDQGEVLAVGSGKKTEDGKVRPLDVKVGDKVLFGKYSGQTVKVKGEELLVIREEDVMGVLDQKTVDDSFDLKVQLKNVGRIFERVFKMPVAAGVS